MKKIIRDIFEQFRLIDAFRVDFKREFTQAFYQLTKQLYQLKRTPELDEYIDLMAKEALRFTEDVIEKDRHYAEYRLVDELKLMNAVLAKNKIPRTNKAEAQQVRFQLNELILKHYPALYELSSFGYRLLDRNVNFFTARFVRAMSDEIKHKKIAG
ncbi:hypothetical protein [Mangrovibacterium marinum]|uniref:hypothetical protein n=1 Tax=Mangrovibacterium marinum TaxID=1639118 RepID=UPI002A18E1FE|nr:hypothetical protein [Mangrovibacterium marinum]